MISFYNQKYDLYFVAHCKPSKNYSGTKNVTVTGKKCLPWRIALTKYKADSFPEKSFEAVVNYCRDPEDKGFVWCYVLHDSFENCAVDLCGVF